jgi:para-aminobenzoate synthetase component 1
MVRVERSYTIHLDENLKQCLLRWAYGHSFYAWLDSNLYKQTTGTYQAILAVGRLSELSMNAQGAFDALESYREKSGDWLFGYLGYDLKNDLEQLSSKNFDGPGFADMHFFQPERILLIQEKCLTFVYPSSIEQEIEIDYFKIFNNSELRIINKSESSGVAMHLRTSKDNYFEKIDQVLGHIERGDIYEVNFCQEVYAEDVAIDPLSTFLHLNAISRPPFASFLRLGDRYVLSASPERYLKKKGSRVWSQPIKGTAGREADPTSDRNVALRLAADPKERSENIMITDLVRNDLSRVAIKGSVQVDELCQVYTFEQVHQLISTVSCRVPDDQDPIAIIRATFPMGSMTGAPKISAMEIIEELEDAKRGVYSGAIGYFDPKGDFDFNVVIRSILYNAGSGYLSFSVGGAITAASIPENEYQECLVKARALREVLERNSAKQPPTQ